MFKWSVYSPNHLIYNAEWNQSILVKDFMFSLFPVNNFFISPAKFESPQFQLSSRWKIGIDWLLVVNISGKYCIFRTKITSVIWWTSWELHWMRHISSKWSDRGIIEKFGAVERKPKQFGWKDRGIKLWIIKGKT